MKVERTVFVIERIIKHLLNEVVLGTRSNVFTLCMCIAFTHPPACLPALPRRFSLVRMVRTVRTDALCVPSSTHMAT